MTFTVATKDGILSTRRELALESPPVPTDEGKEKKTKGKCGVWVH